MDGLEQRVQKCTEMNKALEGKVHNMESENRSLLSQLKKLQAMIVRAPVQTSAFLMVINVIPEGRSLCFPTSCAFSLLFFCLVRSWSSLSPSSLYLVCGHLLSQGLPYILQVCVTLMASCMFMFLCQYPATHMHTQTCTTCKHVHIQTPQYHQGPCFSLKLMNLEILSTLRLA